MKSRCQKRYTSRGKPWKAAAKNDAQVVESRGKPLPKTMHKSWKAAAKNDAQVVDSRGKPLPKTMRKSWKAAALIGGTKLSKNSE